MPSLPDAADGHAGSGRRHLALPRLRHGKRRSGAAAAAEAKAGEEAQAVYGLAKGRPGGDSAGRGRGAGGDAAKPGSRRIASGRSCPAGPFITGTFSFPFFPGKLARMRGADGLVARGRCTRDGEHSNLAASAIRARRFSAPSSAP